MGTHWSLDMQASMYNQGFGLRYRPHSGIVERLRWILFRVGGRP